MGAFSSSPHRDSKKRSEIPANQTVQRTGASRFAQRQIKHQRRLAPVADLFVKRDDHMKRDSQEFKMRLYEQIKRLFPEDEIELLVARAAGPAGSGQPFD